MHLINLMDFSKMFTFESITFDHPQNPHVFEAKSSSNLNFSNFWLLILGGGESFKHAKNSSKHVQGIKHCFFLQDAMLDVCSFEHPNNTRSKTTWTGDGTSHDWVSTIDREV